MNDERYPSGFTNCPVCGGKAHWCVDDIGTSLFCDACDMREHMEWLDDARRINAEYAEAVPPLYDKKRRALDALNRKRDLRNHSVDFHWSEFPPYVER